MILSAQPTKLDEAIKSVQQWNEALKIDDHDSIRRSRPTSLSPMPTRKELTQSRLHPPGPTKQMNVTTARPNAEAFRSPDIESSDNWDADFASSISPRALQFPHLKPQDNFSGMLSMENLKSFANVDSSTMEYRDGDSSFRGRMSGKFAVIDPMETVKPYTPKRSRAERQPIPNTSSQRIKGQVLRDTNANTKTSSQPPKQKVAQKARPSASFREDGIEDYSDLLDSADDDAFQAKLAALKIQDPASSSFAPKLFHPSDLKNSPKPVSYGRKSTSLRRFPSAEQPITPALTRTQSSVEIQKYAEDENEDPEAFFEQGLVLPGSDSGSDRGTLMMSNSKFSTQSVDEDEEYDDPFAQLEEDFDQMDLEANVARDRYARLCTFVEGLVAGLQVGQSEEVLDDLTDQLVSTSS